MREQPEQAFKNARKRKQMVLEITNTNALLATTRQLCSTEENLHYAKFLEMGIIVLARECEQLNDRLTTAMRTTPPPPVKHPLSITIEHPLWARQWKAWECKLMNIIDCRYWQCECEYRPPHGKVIAAHCQKHEEG